MPWTPADVATLSGPEDTPGGEQTPWRGQVNGVVEALSRALVGASTTGPAGAGAATLRSDRPSGPDSAGGIPPGPSLAADDDVACVRRAFQCEAWAAAGECSNNPQFMNNVCYHDCA